MRRLFSTLVMSVAIGAAAWIGWEALRADRGTLPVVRPILFIPANLAASPDDASNVELAMQDLQQFYAEQLSGKTFRYDALQVRKGTRELAFYCPKTRSELQCIQQVGAVGPDPGDVLKVINDINAQGFNAGGRGQALLIFWVGGYSFAGGEQRSADSGYVAVGDWMLDSIGRRHASGTATGGCSAAPPSAQAACQDNPSELIHELGHLFGLPHPKADDTKRGDPNYWARSVMDHAFGCQWPDCGFLASKTNPEVQTLIASPFIY